MSRRLDLFTSLLFVCGGRESLASRGRAQPFHNGTRKSVLVILPPSPPSLPQRAFRAFRLQQPRFPVIPFPHGPSPSKKQQLRHGMMFLKKVIISLYYINYEHKSFPDVRPAAPSAPSAYGRSAFQPPAGRYTNAGHFPFPAAPTRRATPWLFSLFFSLFSYVPCVIHKSSSHVTHILKGSLSGRFSVAGMPQSSGQLFCAHFLSIHKKL